MSFWSRQSRKTKWLLAVLVFLLVLGITVILGGLYAVRSLLFHRGMDIHIVHDEKTILFCTMTSLRAIRPDSAGRLAERPVKMEQRALFSPFTFPKFYVSDPGEGVPMAMFARLDSPLGRRRKATLSEWRWLWWFDTMALECRPLVKWERYFHFPRAIVCSKGEFPVFVFEPPERIDGRIIPLTVSARDGSVSPMQISSSSVAGLILLGDGDAVSVDLLDLSGPRGASDRSLSHGGEEILRDVGEILGTTSDLAHLFFTKHGEGQEAGDGLWEYNPKDHEARKLTDWVGQKFRVSQETSRFGFLKASSHEAIFGGAMNPAPVIYGARIFDMDGSMVREYSFDRPILASKYDWDPSWEMIAYFTQDSLVVQSLEGDVLGEFSLFRLKDVWEFIKSIRIAPNKTDASKCEQ